MLSKILKAVFATVGSVFLAVILKIKAVSEFLFLDAVANWVNGEIAKKAPEMMENLAPIIGWAVPLFVAVLVVVLTYMGFEWAHGFSGKSVKNSADQEKTPDITDQQTLPDTGSTLAECGFWKGHVNDPGAPTQNELLLLLRCRFPKWTSKRYLKRSMRCITQSLDNSIEELIQSGRIKQYFSKYLKLSESGLIMAEERATKYASH